MQRKVCCKNYSHTVPNGKYVGVKSNWNAETDVFKNALYNITVYRVLRYM